MVKDNGLEYFTELEKDYILMEDLWEIFKLIDNTKDKTLDNIEIRKDLKLILFNPQTLEFYPRYLTTSSNRLDLQKFFNDKNLYINKNDLIWQNK